MALKPKRRVKYEIEGKYIVPKSVLKAVGGPSPFTGKNTTPTPQWYKAKLKGGGYGNEPTDLIIEFWPNRKELEKMKTSDSVLDSTMGSQYADKNKIWLVEPWRFESVTPSYMYSEKRLHYDYNQSKSRKEKVYQMTPIKTKEKRKIDGKNIFRKVPAPIIEMKSSDNPSFWTKGDYMKSRGKMMKLPFRQTGYIRSYHFSDGDIVLLGEDGKPATWSTSSGSNSEFKPSTIAIAPKRIGIKMF
jgi:hypothetical protein